MDTQARRAARHARRRSLLPVVEGTRSLLYWGVVYADTTVALVRGANGEHLVRVTAAAKPWAAVARLN